MALLVPSAISRDVLLQQKDIPDRFTHPAAPSPLFCDICEAPGSCVMVQPWCHLHASLGRSPPTTQQTAAPALSSPNPGTNSQRLYESGQDIVDYLYGSEKQEVGDNHIHVTSWAFQLLTATWDATGQIWWFCLTQHDLEPLRFAKAPWAFLTPSLLMHKAI